MAALYEQMKDFVSWADSVSDPRTKDWPLMLSPVMTYSLVALYLVIVRVGPTTMATREPFTLKFPMLLYNFGLVVLSAYMFKEFFVSTVLNPKFDKRCQPVDYSNDPMAVRLANVCWWFFFSKIIELLDTVIFILRKKNNQISFLHVYHHATMPLLWWIGVRWVAGGVSYFSGMINCFVHTFMYSYYFLSALGPRVQPYLWWKKHLTSLQLLQFFAALLHCILVLYQSCGYPTGYVWALVVYLLSHIALFSNFFHKAYVKPKKSKKSKAEEQDDAPPSPRSTANGRYNLRERPPKTPGRD